MKMSFNDVIRKLSSRKFWIAVAGIATGICTIIGADSNEIQTVSGAFLAVASVIGYVFAEASIDKANVQLQDIHEIDPYEKEKNNADS